MSEWKEISHGASRGTAYWVPHTVAVSLQIIDKKLKSAARKIYRGYYEDIINSTGRAKDSAVEMAAFVGYFPAISRFHNRLANIMNAQIEKQNPGEGRVKFPMVGDGTAAGDDDEDVIAREAAQKVKRNEEKWKAEREKKAEKAKKGKKVVASEEMLATAPQDALVDDPEPQSEMREGSLTVVYSPTIANTEVDDPAAVQSSAPSPVSPTGLSSGNIEMNDNDSEMSVGLLDAPGPAGRQSSVTLPASPTILDTEHLEVDNNDNEMSLEPLPEIWDDSIWPHGAWVDGLDVIDSLPWARPTSP